MTNPLPAEPGFSLIYRHLGIKGSYLQSGRCDPLILKALSKYKKYNLNIQPLKVVSRYRDSQLQVTENYSYLVNLRQNICQF